jgi:hypothetical protein
LNKRRYDVTIFEMAGMIHANIVEPRQDQMGA